MKNTTNVSIALFAIVLLLLGVGVYFKDSILGYFDQKFQKLQQIDFGNVVNEIKKEVFTPSPLNIGGSPNDVVLTKAKVIAETNLQRQENGNLPALKENAKLNATALAKANDMFKNQYFEHISPAGVGPGDLAKSHGYDYIIEGENLILGNFKDEQEVVQLWMNSPGHRANIVNNRYTEIGVAIIRGTYKGQIAWMGVQEFGLPLSACPAPDPSIATHINTSKAQLDQLSALIDQKRAEIDNTNKRSEEYNQLVDEYNQMVNQYNALVQETKNLIANYNQEVNTFNQCVSG